MTNSPEHDELAFLLDNPAFAAFHYLEQLEPVQRALFPLQDLDIARPPMGAA